MQKLLASNLQHLAAAILNNCFKRNMMSVTCNVTASHLLSLSRTLEGLKMTWKLSSAVSPLCAVSNMSGLERSCAFAHD
jgi:hypothetical protein